MLSAGLAFRLGPLYNLNMAFVRERSCCDCGKTETVRKDNQSVRCKSCAARLSGAKGLKTIKERAKRSLCERCGQAYSGNNKRFCSKACQCADQAGNRLKLECVTCGCSFTRPRSILGTNASGRFCSRDCYHTHLCRTERISGRGSQWNKARKEALQRAPFCAVCGTRRGLQVHHVIPFRISFDNNQNNLIPLCVKHHRWVEHLFVGTEREGLPPMAGFVWLSMLKERQLATAVKMKQVWCDTNSRNMAGGEADGLCPQPAQE